MVILGAKGFAKELLTVLRWNDSVEGLHFFDDVNPNTPDHLFDAFPVLKSWEALADFFSERSPDFVLGIGRAQSRCETAEKAIRTGGHLCSVISKHALIGEYGNTIGAGVCVLSHATITCDVTIGKGSLINKASIISHDAALGSYCTIGPGARINGRASVGDLTEVGTNAVVLPSIKVGANCKVGAGSVVTHDVPDNVVVVGVPARPLTNSRYKEVEL